MVRLSNFGTLTLSPKTVHLQRIKADEDLEPAGTGDEERTSRTTAAFQKQFKYVGETSDIQRTLQEEDMQFLYYII